MTQHFRYSAVRVRGKKKTNKQTERRNQRDSQEAIRQNIGGCAGEKFKIAPYLCT